MAIVKSFLWPDEAATEAFAQKVARYWQAHPDHGNMVVLLHGDLGAGKTTLVRHLLRNLGVQGRIKSPTYAVVEPYQTPLLAIWHFDFYRFSDPQEWEDAGFRDIFASPGLKLAEWPEKAQGMLPPADWEITLTTHPDATREVTVHAATPRGAHVLQEIST